MRAVSVSPIVYADDALQSASWYERLGFVVEFTHRFSDDSPLVVGMASGDARIMLSEHQGDARPDGLIYVRVDDLDEAARAVGATPEEQEWGLQEAHTQDPAANRVRIGES